MELDTFFPADTVPPWPTKKPAPYAVLERNELLALARAALATGPLDADAADALGSLVWRAAAAHPDDDEVCALRDCVSPAGLASVLDLTARFHREIHAISGWLLPEVAAAAHRTAAGLVDWCRCAAREHALVPQSYQFAVHGALAQEFSRTVEIARRRH